MDSEVGRKPPALQVWAWTKGEDEILLEHVKQHGTRKWKELVDSGRLLKRSTKACCNRFRRLKESSSETLSAAELGFGFDCLRPWGAHWSLTSRGDHFHDPHPPAPAPAARHLQPLSLPTRLADPYTGATPASNFWGITACSQGASTGSAAAGGYTAGAQGTAASKGALGTGGAPGALGPTQQRQGWVHQGSAVGSRGGLGGPPGAPSAAGSSGAGSLLPGNKHQALSNESAWQAARRQLVLQAGGEWRDLLAASGQASALGPPPAPAQDLSRGLPPTRVAARAGLVERCVESDRGVFSEGVAFQRASGAPQGSEPPQAFSEGVHWPAPCSPNPGGSSGPGGGHGFQDSSRKAAQEFEAATTLFSSLPRQHSLAMSFQEVAQAAPGALAEKPGAPRPTWHSNDWKQILLETEGGAGLSHQEQDGPSGACVAFEASAPAYGTESESQPYHVPGVHREAPLPEGLAGAGRAACDSADPHAWPCPTSTQASFAVHQGHTGAAHQGHAGAAHQGHTRAAHQGHAGAVHPGNAGAHQGGFARFSGQASSSGGLRELQGLAHGIGMGMDRRESLGLETVRGESDLLQSTIQAALQQLGERGGGQWGKEGRLGGGGEGAGLEGRAALGGGNGTYGTDGDGQSAGLDTAVLAQGLASWRESDAETIADILAELVGQHGVPPAAAGGLTPGLSPGSGLKGEALTPLGSGSLVSGSGFVPGAPAAHHGGAFSPGPVPQELPVLPRTATETGSGSGSGSGRQLLSRGGESWIKRLQEGGVLPGYTAGGGAGSGPEGGEGLSGGSSLDLPQHRGGVLLGQALLHRGRGASGPASPSPATSGASLVPPLRGCAEGEAQGRRGGASLGALLSPPEISHQPQDQHQPQHQHQHHNHSIEAAHWGLRETSSEKSAWPRHMHQGHEWSQQQGGSRGGGGSRGCVGGGGGGRGAGWSAGHERVKRMRCMSDGGVPERLESLQAGARHGSMAQNMTSYSELIRLQNTERKFPDLHALDA